MPEDQLINYIKQSKNAQIPSEQITQNLINAGWQASDILRILIDKTIRENYGFAQEQAIVIENLSKSFGSIKALSSVSLAVESGKIIALLGPNGAGKTTLIRILTTLLKPDSGTAKIAGYDVIRDAKSLRSIIGLAGQYAAIDENLTGKENLEMVGRLSHLNRIDARDRAGKLLKTFDLEDAANRLAKTYSGGMRRRLDLAASLVGQPQILFLDEPTAGLDPHGRNNLWRIIKELVAQGTTLLLTTQYMEEADHLADAIVVLDRGRVIAAGTPKELKLQIGGDFLEIHLANHTDTEKAVQLISHLGHEQPYTDHEIGQITLPIKDGAAVLIDTVRLLDNANIKIADIVLRRPTLDDVFLTLTGHLTQGVQLANSNNE